MPYLDDDQDPLMSRRRPRAPVSGQAMQPAPAPSPLMRTPPFLPSTKTIAPAAGAGSPLLIQRPDTMADETGMAMPARPLGPAQPQGIPGMEGRTLPEAVAPKAAVGPENRAQELAFARAAYDQGTPTGFKGRLLSGLRAGVAGRGFLSGVVDPRGEREAQFYEKEAPRLAQRWGFEDQQKAAELAAAQRAQEATMSQAKLAEMQSQIDARNSQEGLSWEKFNAEQEKPTLVQPGVSVLPPGSTAPTYTAPEKLTPHWERDDRTGNWVDLNAKENKGKIFKAQRKGKGGGGGEMELERRRGRGSAR